MCVCVCMCSGATKEAKADTHIYRKSSLGKTPFPVPIWYQMRCACVCVRVQQRRQRRILYRSKVVRYKVDRNTKTVVIWFFASTGGIVETLKLCPKAYVTHKPTYAYLPLFKGSWNMQEKWDSELFWFDDGRICGGFPPISV